MTNEEAIKEIEQSGLYGNQVHQETLELALSALRAQLECEKEHIGETTDMMPLTLDELREMGKTDWVWLTFPELPPEESGWYRSKQVYATYSHKHYGDTWIAYRTKPKENANG